VEGGALELLEITGLFAAFASALWVCRPDDRLAREWNRNSCVFSAVKELRAP
jgi:hypothetical protein